MIQVWWAAPSAVEDRPAEIALLTEVERARMRRFQRPADRERFLTAWALARRVLGDLTRSDPRTVRIARDCQLCGDPSHGKPRVLGGTWDFSLSHAGDRVLLAVSDDGLVGVDVEVVERGINELADLVLHPKEPRAAGLALLRVWVRKEAALKATGHGLVKAMTSFSLVDPPWDSSVWDLAADPGYVAAIAHIPRSPARSGRRN